MGPVSIRSVVHPPVLAIVCEYPTTQSMKQTQSTKLKKEKLKGKKSNDTIVISDESDHDDVDVDNFVMSLEVVVEEVKYVWVGAIMHSPGHFWSVLWHEGKVWEYGWDSMQTVRVRPGLPSGQSFTVSSGQNSRPQYILYVRKDLLDQKMM